ncbi:MAG: Trk system potassium transporter TrkA [Oscillospiraceae bacterium]
MKIVIIGGGKVGFTIAEQLTKEGHDIIVVDNDRQVVNNISESLDVMAVCGNGASVTVMREAEVGSSDLLIACTAQDELNMLCCVFAKKLGCQSTIARVRTPEYAEQMLYLQSELGLSMTINPELQAAREIFRLLELPGVLKRDSFAKGRVEIVEIVPKAGDILDGTRLYELPKKLKCRALVGAVQRGREVFIPDGNFTLREGDRVYLCAPAMDIVRILQTIGENKKRARNVMLIGGSRICDYLTPMLLKAGAKVKIIEQNPPKAAAIAERYPAATVVCEDGSNQAVLNSEHAEQMDAVALLTNIDEENLILAMYMSHIGVPQVISKVNHTEFASFIAEQGVNRIVSPKKICADVIIRYVRAMQNTEGSSVLALHHLVDGKAAALEFIVTKKCKYLGKPLMEKHLKPNILIASISRFGRIIVPGGSDTIEEGDTVVVITSSDRVILDLNDIFEPEV